MGVHSVQKGFAEYLSRNQTNLCTKRAQRLSLSKPISRVSSPENKPASETEREGRIP